MERSAWTDERLDDLAACFDRTVTLLHEDIRSLRDEMNQGFRELRGDMSALQRQLSQIGWGLVVALIGAIVALVVAVA